MTSTNIFSGFSGDKNSSKVLRPPGGGHTDIFGAAEPPVKKDSGRNTSSILEGTNFKTEPLKPTTPTKATSPLEKGAPTPAEAASASARPRVPPGGFSSGPLW
ncbi:uncharacterized protein [Euwallacea fornicatus]|uniref:uncharacterized protein n=1 Tax=Euwallacea fornicatus TaxID=995702 RepID=UPI0033907354